MNKTNQIYEAVKAHPGVTVKDIVIEGMARNAISATLSRLEHKLGRIRSEESNGRPKRYFAIDGSNEVIETSKRATPVETKGPVTEMKEADWSLTGDEFLGKFMDYVSTLNPKYTFLVQKLRVLQRHARNLDSISNREIRRLKA